MTAADHQPHPKVHGDASTGRLVVHCSCGWDTDKSIMRTHGTRQTWDAYRDHWAYAVAEEKKQGR